MTKAEIIVNISEKTGVEKIVVASIVEGFMSEVKSNVIAVSYTHLTLPTT